LLTRRVVSAIPAVRATKPALVWKGSCTCSTQTRPGWSCPIASSAAADPQARHRWPVERTNAWLKAKRRIATRRDRKADNYLAFLHLAMILVLNNSF